MAEIRSDLEILLDTVEAEARTPVINVSHQRGDYPFAGCTMQDENDGRGTRVYLDPRCTVDVTDAFNAWAAEHQQPRNPKMLELVRRVREQLKPRLCGAPIEHAPHPLPTQHPGAWCAGTATPLHGFVRERMPDPRGEDR